MVRLRDDQFGDVLDGDESLGGVDFLDQGFGEGGFTGSGCAADDDVFMVFDGETEELEVILGIKQFLQV